VDVRIADGGRRKVSLYGDEEEAAMRLGSGARVEEDEKEEVLEAGEGTRDRAS